MPLLQEIQTNLINRATKLSDTLRKTKILAHRLKNEDLKRWIDLELKGYDGIEADDLPDYRKAVTQSQGQFLQLGGMWDNMPIRIPRDAGKPYVWANTMYFREGVNELEALLEGGKGVYEQAWPTELVATLSSLYKVQCLRAWKLSTSAQIEFVLDSIRTRLLNFLLEVGDIAPDAGEGIGSNVPNDKLQQTFITSIYGGSNVIASGHSFQQGVDQRTIGAQPDDIARAFGIIMEKVNSLQPGQDKAEAESAVKELENEARKGKQAQERSLRKWLNFLLETAPDAWQVAIDTFVHPIKGVSTIFQKIADKARTERDKDS